LRNALYYRCSAPAVWNSLPQTVLSSDSVAVFKSIPPLRLSLLSLLTNTLPGPSASEVTTLWRYTNLFIIIIIIIIIIMWVAARHITVTEDTAAALTVRLVQSRLDYANSVENIHFQYQIGK